MSDFGDIEVSKHCQSYRTWHESIFDNQIVWKIDFKNHIFQKFQKIMSKFSKNLQGKKM